MRIEELVIEGFKSYPVRTQITGWDPSFNAITGLNGSGKSNILDAICFVLGITNMTTMRASNQQDLIYKRGQAGVTRASVTIVFDNSDRSKSPTGFEQYKQITVTRQIAIPNVSKYLLNGHKSTQGHIQTLFQSVQLNINNPNFVIMQGRITKVLNMRPQEILGLVEEAAGTRMFEERKDKAKKTMSKKEKRVEEITAILEEEITPKLNKLREEKRSYLQYQKTCTELERIGRLLRAWEWMEGKKRVGTKEAELDARRVEVKEVHERQARISREIKAAEEDVKDVIKKRDAEMKKGGKLKLLEEQVTELGKNVVKINTQADIARKTIQDEKSKIVDLDNEIQEHQTAFQKKKVQVDALSAAYNITKEKHTTMESARSSSEELLQSLLTGLTSTRTETSAGGGYMGQIADARARAAQAAAEEEQSRVRLGMAQRELKALETRWKEVEREAGDGRKRIERTKQTVEGCRAALARCKWNEELENNLEAKLKEARDNVAELSHNRDRVKQNLGRLNFDYVTPSPHFDRAKVRGLAATLITLEEQNYNASTALEIAAGGKLYQVVVEDERTGAELLKHGQLKRRVTLIPLNKVSAFTVSNQKLQLANRLAPGKVRTALSLVGYADDVAKAITYVFSDTLICDDAESAKRVTFHREVGVRSVTLQGDVYDPSGTLSGGSAPSGSGVLIQVQKLLEVESRLNEARRNLHALEVEEGRSKKDREDWKVLKRDLEMKEHELKLLEGQIEGSNAARIGAEVEERRKTIADLESAIQSAKDKQMAAKEECKKLERDMAEFKNNKEGKIDELKANISQQKTALQKHAVIVKTEQKELQTATLELEQFQSDIESFKAGRDEATSGIEGLERDLAKLVERAKKEEAAHAQAEAKLQEELATLSRFDNELKALDKVIKEKRAAVLQANLDIKESEHAIQTLGKERTAAMNFVTNLEKQYEWILQDKDEFGRPGSHYDFDAMDVNQLRGKAVDLENAQKGMKKKVNPKAINIIEGVVTREEGLKKMLGQVLKDKKKIEETVEELDRYKRDALQKTWEKVDGDFGAIFAELLPGNFAKLVPPEGQDLVQGLEVKVQLGTVWKESLTELSGGQRSLIALSLIMALLQFKPAPMYILDEIDAALDLSHTQHIGQLFRTRFKGSQFIVVSLKEGLFTNANVLFRARFRDGTSIVERTAQRSTSALYTAGAENEGEDGNERRRRRRGGDSS
ncbi:condensin complex subunit SMC2 [Amanita rubescens]|nr:condensin complex subunit SMC2 [Amanita rubescens]